MSLASQLTLGLFDNTALGGTLGLSAGTGFSFTDADDDDDAPPSVPETARIPALNFRLVGDRGLAHGWKARAGDNIFAVRLLQQLESEDRAATADEQARLMRFTGFGASELANSLFPLPGEDFRTGWESLGQELAAATTEAERAGLMRATQYAHYTPEYIVRAMWTALGGMGFAGGHILEPGCGTGLFLALMPEKAAAKASITAIEMDPITARIAGKLFPEAWVRPEDFTRARIAERFELAIGNPPFSDRTVRADDAAGRLGLSLHDYFIARSIERLKPGGIAAFVSSRWTMDKTSRTAREHIAEMADLVGAVRLPQAAMLADAGTEVVVDVLLFRKRLSGEESRGTDWTEVHDVPNSDEGEGSLAVNGYLSNGMQN